MLPVVCCALLASGLAATASSAHVLLDEPARRYDDMKGAVCGKGGGDDGRTGHFTRYQPGDTIDVKFTETVDHVGSFRFAFDDDGGDRDDFDGNVLDVIDDPSNESGKQRTGKLTLPDVECTNCTLQLIQIMTTGTPTDENTYFQCADIVLGDGESAGAEVGGCAQAGTPSSALMSVALLLLLRRRRR